MSALLAFPLVSGYDIVPLSSAVLCQDCETISSAPFGCCLACGSQSVLSLARVLNRSESNCAEAREEQI